MPALRCIQKRLLCMEKTVRESSAPPKTVFRKTNVRVFNDSKGRYGSPKVHQALRKRGDRCSKNTVAKIMRRKGLKARVNRVYVRNPKVHRFFKRIGNLRLDQNKPEAVNQVWVGGSYLHQGWKALSVFSGGVGCALPPTDRLVHKQPKECKINRARIDACYKKASSTQRADLS